MYLQITTRCNMECEHCCYACTSKGKDMSLKTFKNALAIDDECVSLGGGEPTIHPKFWEFIGLALGHSEYVWLAINGKKTDAALALARMARKGVLGCALSQDNYHEPIEDRVIKAFTKEKRDGVGGYYNKNDNDQREIRNVTSKEINGGRCDFGKEDGCVCSDLLCEPDGNVKACGCKDSPSFGNVNTEVNIPENWEVGECYKNQS